ncbi:MAG TPA: cation transporter [Stellaceae bacterium]|jgi:divalent metal cation (Fe/Co/Zn/Cd) transporter|nr:cation transporter [Stellaceae bacterium]
MTVTVPAIPGHTVAPEYRAKEQAILLALSLDLGMMTTIALIGFLGGSLTMVAETIRAIAANTMEAFGLAVMRRIHRGVLFDLQYGSGKLEQVANVAIAGGMLFGAAWILTQAVSIVTGSTPTGRPFGLAMAAIAGAVNAYLNLVSWDAVRRVAGGGSRDSIIMRAQLTSRVVKLLSSLLIMVTLTIAAVATDEIVVAAADATGSVLVSIVIIVSALRILQDAVPDLLDRSAGAAVQAAIERALERHRDAYAALRRVRSRRSGHVVFVEIALSFSGDLRHAEVERHTVLLHASLREEIGEADIAIVIEPPAVPEA